MNVFYGTSCIAGGITCEPVPMYIGIAIRSSSRFQLGNIHASQLFSTHPRIK